MTTLTQNRITVAVAVGLPAAVALWLLTAATAVTSTHVFLALLVISTAFIGYNTWRNGQPAGSLAQVIHEAELAPVTARTVTGHPDRTGTSRWNAWQSRGDGLAHTGRVRALLALSLAVTGMLLLYAWFA